jgi:organic radical activating enzyme
MPDLLTIQPFLAGARFGEQLDPAVFVDFAKQYREVVIWGAGNLGTAVGKRLLNIGVNLTCYWDAQANKINVCNEVSVLTPFAGKFDKDATLVLFCIGNVAVGPNIQRQLAENGWHHVIHGNDLLQGLLCPLANGTRPNTKMCNRMDICSVCSCERLHNIVRTNVSRELGISPDDSLSFDRIHFITNNVCNLKCTHCFLYINSYPKQRKQNVSTRQILQDIDVTMRAIHSLGVVNVFGGEPFLHKDIDKIADRILAYKSFGAMILNTNGVANIKPSQFECLKDGRVRLAFSNYLEAMNEKQIATFFKNIEAARANGVNAKYQNTLPTWNTLSTLENKGDSVEVMVEKKDQCNVRFLYVFDGKLFPCAFTLSIHDLDIANYATDYVVLNPDKSPVEIQDEIRNLISRTYYRACGHCESFGSPALTSSAAEQGFDKRYALPESRSVLHTIIPVVATS